MNIESARRFCLSIPFTTELIQWPDALTFSVGGKPFTVVTLDPASSHRISFRCTPEQQAELVKKRDIIPCPDPERKHWISLLRFDAMEEKELKRLIRTSHQLVFSSLPPRLRKGLQGYSAGK